MSIRLSWVLALTLPFLLVGCGEPPEAQFVTSQRAQELVRQAQRPVEETIEQSFGTPHDLVAWLRLPIDFGQFQGTVLGPAPGGSGHQILARLESAGDDPASLPSSDFRGMGILWTSGMYQGNTQVRIESYDAKAKILTLQQNLDTPPEEGATFIAVGHKLQEGRKLYMRHCMHCHGVSGDGNGPTAPYLNPKPRDYRLGLFKFTSTQAQEKATRDDLKRIVKLGIPGTYMPSFMLLEDEELSNIIEYVRFLAMRGEFENKLVTEFYADYSNTALQQRTEGGESRSDILNELQDRLENDYPRLVDELSQDLADAWVRAEEESSLIIPKQPRTPDTPESRARGRALFVGAKAKCATCHGPTGHGDGSQTEDFQKDPRTNEYFAVRGLHDQWGNPIRPRDLTRGIYRGGRRPIDLYRRIYAGIKGTPMAGFATSLNDEEIWDLVNYVLSIPFEDQSAGPRQAAPQMAATAQASEDGRN